MKPTLLLSLLWLSVLHAQERGSAVFLHPDGTGLGHWHAARIHQVGPDGDLNWDRLERLSIYRPHQKNWLSSSSHAGATVHAYGVKVHRNSYGLDRDQPLTAASGKALSIMKEAQAAGLRVGIVNSGHIGEPGTGVFLASVLDRKEVDNIAAQIVASGAEVILCAGEVYLLPEGVNGFFGQPGKRTDGRNLLEEARAAGYTVIFSREELEKLPADTPKVLGIFAAENTYNDFNEADLKARGLPLYNHQAPRFEEMVAAALRLLGSDPAKEFLLVAEEEGTDNFSNYGNAAGMLEALRRADAGIGEVLKFMQAQPERRLLLLTAADSDAGQPALWTPPVWPEDKPVPLFSSSGAALDGRDGAESPPFLSAPDALGARHPFAIAWPVYEDVPGTVVARAHGFRSGLLGPTLDNTGVYRILYEVLFGAPPAGAAAEP